MQESNCVLECHHCSVAVSTRRQKMDYDSWLDRQLYEYDMERERSEREAELEEQDQDQDEE